MLKVKKLNDDAKVMVKAYKGDAGFDVFCTENFDIWPGEVKTIALGLAVEFPSGNVLIVNDKSGLAVKNGIHIMGGIIDSNYRGEIHVCMVNFSKKEKVIFEKGQKVAQLLLMPCYTGTDIEIVDELSDTDRGDNGFGSTGK